MLKTSIDLSDLEQKSRHLIELVDGKVEELENMAPQLGVREYMKRISDEFKEEQFNPLDDIWEEEIRRLMDKYDKE